MDEDEGPRLVVGLGNPGPDYAGNRHNVGVMVLDVLGDRVGGRFAVHRRSNTEVLTGRLAGHRVVLARPRTYMNTSGGPVAGVAAYHSVEPDRIIVIHDELDIPYDTIRLKLGGGDNGHNGLRSVTRSLGTNEYLRVRVGIGRPPGRQDPAEFVLRDFSTVERKELGVHLERAADAVEVLLRAGLVAAQNSYHA